MTDTIPTACSACPYFEHDGDSQDTCFPPDDEYGCSLNPPLTDEQATLRAEERATDAAQRENEHWGDDEGIIR